MLIVNQLCGFGAGGVAPPSLIFLASGSVAAATTTTISGVSFGAAAPGREIFVVFTTTTTTGSVGSVSIGGVSASVSFQAGALPSNFGLVAVARATVPTGTSGNVVITYPVTPTAATEYAVYMVTGRASVGSGPTDTAFTATGTAATTAVMTGIDTPASGFVLAAVVSQSSVTPAISGAGLAINTPVTALRAFASSPVLTTANSNVSATWTFTTSARCVCAAFSFSS